MRELSNVIERLVILSSEGRVGHAHVRESLVGAQRGASPPRTADELNALRRDLREHAADDAERGFLLAALRRNDYNVTRAATETDMQRSNFQALLKKHGLRIRDLMMRHDQSENA